MARYGSLQNQNDDDLAKDASTEINVKNADIAAIVKVFSKKTIMQLNNNKRDVQLDMYRGLSILYVVCFIHVLYWLNIGKQPFMSMILFEMPVIFFISGASLSFSKNPRPVKKTLKSRFYRLLLPYYIYRFNIILFNFSTTASILQFS